MNGVITNGMDVKIWAKEATVHSLEEDVLTFQEIIVLIKNDVRTQKYKTRIL